MEPGSLPRTMVPKSVEQHKLESMGEEEEEEEEKEETLKLGEKGWEDGEDGWSVCEHDPNILYENLKE